MNLLRLAAFAALFLPELAIAGAVLPPGGSNGQLQQNCNGSFCGINGVPVNVNAQIGATYTIQSTDQGALVTVANSSGPAITLPQSNTFSAGWATIIENIGSAAATIGTSGADTLACSSGWGIQGNACTTITLNQFDSVTLQSAGTSNSWSIVFNPGSNNAPVHPIYKATTWYPQYYGFTPTAGSTANANYAICAPIVVQGNIGIDGLAVTITTTGTSGQTGELALYTSHPTKGVPYKRIGYSNSFSLVQTTPYEVDGYFASGTVHVNPGIYWACIDISGSGAAFESANTGITAGLFFSGATNQTNMMGANTAAGLWVANTYSSTVTTTFPTDFSSASWVASYSSQTPFFAYYSFTVP